MRNRFTNPADNSFYDWPINHTEEEEAGKRRNIQHGALTSNVGLTKSQGDPSPMAFKFAGTILHKAQLQEMWRWYELCETQSIYFRDFYGDEYEVLITGFLPVRKRTIKNPRDTSIPYHYWTYNIEMEVLAIRAGTLSGIVTTP